MTNKSRRSSILIALLLFGISLGAQEIQVSFMDGSVQLKTGSSWKAVNIGDKLAADAVIKLEKNSSLEMKNGNATLIITQAGSYQLKDILASRKQAESNGVAKSLQATFTAMTGNAPVSKQTNVAGVRAKNQSDTAQNYVTSDTQDLIESGQALLQSGKYTDALARFLGAKEEAMEEELPQIQYLTGYTLAMMGDSRRAAKELQGISTSADEDWGGDCILLQARLMADSFAWTDVITLLSKQGSFMANDADRAPVYHFLLGIAWLNNGEAAKARTALSRVLELQPDTDLGRTAAELLKN